MNIETDLILIGVVIGLFLLAFAILETYYWIKTYREGKRYWNNFRAKHLKKTI